MKGRYYVEQYGQIWSFSCKGYRLFLETAAAGHQWQLDNPEYKARRVKKYPPPPAKPINVTDFDQETFKTEREFFLAHQAQTGTSVDPHSGRLWGD